MRAGVAELKCSGHTARLFVAGAKHNLLVLRHLALNAMRKEASKGSLRGKFKRAAWDDGFLASLLEMV